ncbi:MAG: hypothetical protein GQ577_07965, partial [Woeseiaceae bacterium]|nr:hypothetical protein [Woeseiaceae bacterium]
MTNWVTLLLAAQLAAGMPEPEQADIVGVVEGELCDPETVLALPDDTLLVSNMCVSRGTGNGFLTLLSEDGEVIERRIVDGLAAPLGMALVRDQLHVIDNNQVKIFRWPGYAPLATIALETTVANDIAVGWDDKIYVTDTV